MHRFLLRPGAAAAIIASLGCANTPAGPLALVAARNTAATVRQLLAEGHEPDERDRDGLTPLMWAVRNGAVDAMSALLDAGADPDARDRRNGWTPLLHAIHTQQPDAVRRLRERGADPNARTQALTPLLMAAAEPDPVFVTLLLTYGADPRARGNGGATALSQAVSGGAMTDIDRPLFGGCHLATVRVLKEHDPTVDVPDTIVGWNVLWWARFHGCQDVLNLVGPGGLRRKR